MTTAKKSATAKSLAPQEVAPEGENELKEGASEVQKPVYTEASEAATITLDEYLKRVKVNPGLVASFRYEAGSTSGGLEPKTEQQWKDAIAAQTTRTYS